MQDWVTLRTVSVWAKGRPRSPQADGFVPHSPNPCTLPIKGYIQRTHHGSRTTGRVSPWVPLPAGRTGPLLPCPSARLSAVSQPVSASVAEEPTPNSPFHHLEACLEERMEQGASSGAHMMIQVIIPSSYSFTRYLGIIETYKERRYKRMLWITDPLLRSRQIDPIMSSVSSGIA